MNAYQYSPTATMPADYDQYYALKRALDVARMRRYSARIVADGAKRNCGPCPFTNEVTAEYAETQTAYTAARATLTQWLKERATCPACHGDGFIADGPDEVTYCDHPDCTAWKNHEPPGCDDQPDWRLNAIDRRYRESLGYQEAS